MSRAERCVHGNAVTERYGPMCVQCLREGRYPVTDEAKRAADIVNGYVAFIPWEELSRSWIAIRLADGGHDGTLYPSKREAVRHQADEYLCAYMAFSNFMTGVKPVDMQLWLAIQRHWYDNGGRTADRDDPGGGPTYIQPVTREDMQRELNHAARTARRR